MERRGSSAETDRPFNAPQTIQSAAVASCPTRKVLYARWSSSESSAAVISGKAVTVGSVLASAKYEEVCTAVSARHREAYETSTFALSSDRPPALASACTISSSAVS